ncbi:MAG: ParB/RepB/Spo0J family partition protein [Acidimicrobiales bacterium]
MGDSLDDLLGLGSSAPRPSHDPTRDQVERADIADRDDIDLLRLPVTAIRPNTYQPRVDFDEGELDELAASVAAVGVLQPVLVRRVDIGRYELVAGERRWRAAQRAGLTHVLALVREVGDRQALEEAVVENLHRSDLNALEEAAAYRQLIDEFGLSQEDVARRVGKTRPAVANTLRLLQLPPVVQRLVRSGALGAGHARALLGLADARGQLELAERVVAEELSVRQVEEAVRALLRASGDRDRDRSRRGPSGAKPAPALEIERLLAERLDTRVDVSLGGGRGRLVIEFADLDDLGRVYQALIGDGEGDAGDRSGRGWS